MSPRPASGAAVLGAALLLLAGGCGGGGSGGLTSSVGLAGTDCIVIDLATGRATAVRRPADLLTDPAYRTTKLVLVALPAGSRAGGAAPGERWAQVDELPTTVGSGRVFMSVFEVTQGQWRRLAGSEPWLAVVPADAGGTVVDDETPAYGISLREARRGLAVGSARVPGAFALPTAAQWEYACRAGTATAWSWGSAIDAGTVDAYAVVDGSGATGPQRVGPRLANGFGLYDMHGNVWELTDDGGIRGGSWRHGLPLARSANRVALDEDAAHALVGVRLLYRADVP